MARKNTTKVERIRAVAYARVSTQEQADSGLSLASQREKLAAYCTLKGVDLVAVLEDPGVSASKPLATRPAGSKLVEMVRRGEVQAVVSIKLDRAFRDASDCLATTAEWDKADVAFHVLDLGGNAVDTKTATGRFMLTVIAAAAEMERNLAGERTAAALAQRKAEGGDLGTAGYGERWEDGKKVAVEDEVVVMGRIVKLRRTGMSLQAVANVLNADGITTKRGAAWRPVQVKRVLDRAGVVPKVRRKPRRLHKSTSAQEARNAA